MKKIIILLTLLSVSVYAEDREANESKYIYDLDQDTKYFHHKIDMNNIQIKDKPRKDNIKLKAKEYNEENFMATRMGVQQETFEEKQGFFVESFTPAIDIIFYKKMFDNFYWTFDFQASKNNMIARQSLAYNFNISSFKLRPFIRLGEKVAFTEQVNSGYFFFNVGGQVLYKISKYDFLVEAYSSPNEFSKTGFYIEATYALKNNKVGLYFGQEHYDQDTLEYERQGQETNRFGIILKF